MLKLGRALLVPLMLFPLPGLTADCEVEAQLQEVQIKMCDGERFLGTLNGNGSFVNRIPYDAIPVGLEKFWSDLCNCYLWQVSGIAGAHTRVVGFYQSGSDGRLTLISGGEFGSEIGKISRVSQTSEFIVEVQDRDVAGKRRTWER